MVVPLLSSAYLSGSAAQQAGRAPTGILRDATCCTQAYPRFGSACNKLHALRSLLLAIRDPEAVEQVVANEHGAEGLVGPGVGHFHVMELAALDAGLDLEQGHPPE